MSQEGERYLKRLRLAYPSMDEEQDIMDDLENHSAAVLAGIRAGYALAMQHSVKWYEQSITKED
jgi:hypothetical protein